MIQRVLIAMLLMGLCLPLSADITFVLGGTACAPAGLCTSNPNATTITFNGETGLTTGVPSVTYNGVATYTAVNPTANSPFVSGSVSGNYAAPPNDSTTYLSLKSPNRASGVDITFTTAMRYFGFYMGSPDAYNWIQFEFINQNQVLKTLNGTQILAGSGIPADGNWATGQYINFYAGVGDSGFDKIKMYSTDIAFETDNHAYASEQYTVITTPEPTGFFLLGLMSSLALGAFSLRKRA